MDALRASLAAAGQGHLLEGWEELLPEEQAALKEEAEVRGWTRGCRWRACPAAG